MYNITLTLDDKSIFTIEAKTGRFAIHLTYCTLKYSPSVKSVTVYPNRGIQGAWFNIEHVKEGKLSMLQYLQQFEINLKGNKK